MSEHLLTGLADINSAFYEHVEKGKAYSVRFFVGVMIFCTLLLFFSYRSSSHVLFDGNCLRTIRMDGDDFGIVFGISYGDGWLVIMEMGTTTLAAFKTSR